MPTISKLYPQYQRINKRKGAKVRKVCKVIRFIPQTESIGNKVAVDKAPARVNGLYELLESKGLLLINSDSRFCPPFFTSVISLLPVSLSLSLLHLPIYRLYRNNSKYTLYFFSTINSNTSFISCLGPAVRPPPI